MAVDPSIGGTFSAPSHTALSKQQGLALLAKLASDDAFRTRFEINPAQALAELGVHQEVILGLRPSCVVPRRLASKDVMELSRQRLVTELDSSALTFQIPSVKI